jgi:hypothetical protein
VTSFLLQVIIYYIASVYCAVRTGALNRTDYVFSFKRLTKIAGVYYAVRTGALSITDCVSPFMGLTKLQVFTTRYELGL